MESRLWKLSGGDIIEVSSVMGHTPGVADNHYLKINDEIKIDGATFVGEAFPDKLRGINVIPTRQAAAKIAFTVVWHQRMASIIVLNSSTASVALAMQL